MKRSWIVLLMIAMAIAAYVNTRGSDGSSLGTIVLFGVIAVVHWAVRLIWLPYASVSNALLELAACELAVIVALAVDPQLDEMGGMLNLFIPVLVFFIITIAYALVVLKRGLLRRHVLGVG